MMPVKQGDLDNFCGIYSLVNAISYLYSPLLKRKNLYLNLVNQYHKRHNIADLINYGMTNVEMDDLIATVLEQGYYHQHYPVKITTPYRCTSALTTPQLFAQINQFLTKSTDNKTTVILGTQYHWSVVRAIDGKYVYFWDSLNFNRACRSSFSLVNQHKRYQLTLDDIYLFERTT